ncbi:MAG: hypothetical protein WC340_00225 [Kiritimatiellia bacterium]
MMNTNKSTHPLAEVFGHSPKDFSDEVESLKTVNVASVPQLSLFRYPGGKTWFVPRLREWLRSQPSKPKILIEPLFKQCAALKGDMIMTYDNASEVMELAARYGFQAKPIAMKSTHHAAMTELVIGKDLDWMQGVDSVLEESAVYKTKA